MEQQARNSMANRWVAAGIVMAIALLSAESYNFPINCGGVLVFPGDVIVADGDGVIVVPRQQALTVGRLAREINLGDEKSRAQRFQKLGIPLDKTVEVK